ncbi:MAG: proline--tRNA ligase [Nanoarchaeota archaeon]
MVEGITAKKEKDFSEWYIELIQKAELADYSSVSGCMVLRPAVYSLWETVQNVVDKEFKKIGIKNAYFPLFIPEKLLKREAKHVEGFSPEVAWVTEAGNSKLSERLAIRPTSETIMYDSYSKWIRSWRDLPLKINQWNNVVRWEFKNPVALLRTREFLWNEGHTVYATKKEADAERDVILKIYSDFLKDYMALYGIIGRKTENEKFAGAENTYSIELFLPSGKGIQGPDFHSDGQTFSKAFNIKFFDKNEKEQHPYQNTFAITTRMLGVMIALHSDNKGLIIPPKMTEKKAVIIPIYKEDSKKIVMDAANKVEKLLKEINAFTDNREDKNPGWKYTEWELKGIPLRIEVGPRDVEKNQVVLVRRDTGEKIIVSIDKLKTEADKVLEKMQKDLYDKSKKFLESNIVEVSKWNEFIKADEDKKLILAPFCGIPSCEEQIKTKTGGVTTRCIPLDKKLKKGDKCIHCGKEAKEIVYFARAY